MSPGTALLAPKFNGDINFMKVDGLGLQMLRNGENVSPLGNYPFANDAECNNFLANKWLDIQANTP